MNDRDEMLQELRKELKVTRICSLVVAALLVIVIVGGIYTVNKISPALTAMQKMQPAIEKMEQLDIEVLNEKIAQLDIEGLNQIVEDLDAAELSEALENLNDAAEMLEELGDGLSSFSNSVNNSLSGLFGSGV